MADVNLSIINGMTPIEELKAGDHVVVDNVVRKIKSIVWSRPCGWYELTYEGDREHEVIYSDSSAGPLFSTVHVVLEL